MNEHEIDGRLNDLESQLKSLRTAMRWMAIFCYFAVMWLLVPALVFRWFGWHVIAWWGPLSFVLGVVLDDYMPNRFKQ
jgi:hypothetical protein